VSAAAAFVFNCHRCGHCCRVGHGRVWIEETEIEALAAACGSSPAAFTARQVMEVSGRLSLREKPDGCCTLLEDGNRCTVYAARPAQCRTFPYWPEILADAGALERASGYCPGIQRIPSLALAAEVLPRALAILRNCARATSSDNLTAGERWACSLEVDLQLSDLLRAQEVSAAAAAAARGELEALASSSGYPWSIGPADRLQAERAQGWRDIHGDLPRWQEAG
jgi:Fe-S-cluster containining protein